MMSQRFCLLLISLITIFFLYRSVQVRQPWNIPTFMSYSNWLESHQHITAATLAYVNNWLKDGPVSLYFGQYMYPKSVETPTLAERKFHPSYPPMITFGLYALFKALEVTGIVPDIYQRRGLQILLVIWLNHIFHFLLALTMCLLVFVVTRNLGFDNLNSTLMAITPSIILFHNAGTLYWFNHLFIAPIIIVPIFAMYVLLEVLRYANPSPRVLKVVRFGQPLVMFVGVFTGWLFPFVIVSVYCYRLARKEIPLPWRGVLTWVKQSLLFFLPALTALALWIYSIVLYQQYVITGSFFDAPTSAMGNTAIHNFLHKMGIVDFQGNLAGLEQKLFWHKQALYHHIANDYGLISFLFLFCVLLFAFHERRQIAKNMALDVFVLLIAPCILYGLTLTVDDANHYFTSIKYAPALSVIFVFAPILILQRRKDDLLLPAMKLMNGGNITLVAAIAVLSSTLWAYSQIFSQERVTRLFSSPKTNHLVVGEFVKNNTDYHDVVFSSDYFFGHPALFIYSFFTIKAMHFADNLDVIYRKTKHIEEKFTVKIFYYQRSEKGIAQLESYLKSQKVSVSSIKHPAVRLLIFDGKEFRSWYRNLYCKEYPQSC